MMDGGEQDRWCLTNPAGVSTSTVSCPYNYCSIVRHEYAKGSLFTFYRGCSSGGAQGVAVVSNFKVYTRLCSTSLCNDWDGVAENSTVDHRGSGDQD
ncbi:hypothetical protein B7P43_G10803 [Cryptotermes secundus]|uniref:UPAR/Ly6 domain-containing protein n=2 Tax=Cryptotermes secundus TaxID=105785 RepID=A0A2J7RRN0_9NEOP|nr:hypothetical protein B7P43_G10803 [Cryptotermes secundus]